MQRAQETNKTVASLGTHKGLGVINTEARMSSKRLKTPVDLGVYSRAFRLSTQEVGKDDRIPQASRKIWSVGGKR